MPVVKPCQLNVFDRFRCLLLSQPCNKLAATSHQLQHQRRAAEWTVDGVATANTRQLHAPARPPAPSPQVPRRSIQSRPRPFSILAQHNCSTRPEYWVQSSPACRQKIHRKRGQSMRNRFIHRPSPFCLRGVFPRCESCRPCLETRGIQMAMFRFIAAHPRRYMYLC